KFIRFFFPLGVERVVGGDTDQAELVAKMCGLETPGVEKGENQLVKKGPATTRSIGKEQNYG
ncbi:MAG: hypothetical protein ACO20L_09360, partial [Candidatus Puniceispirillaceae bacterium]